MISVECHSDSLLVWPWDKNETRKWDSETVLVVTKDFECPEEWMHKRVVSVVEGTSKPVAVNSVLMMQLFTRSQHRIFFEGSSNLRGNLPRKGQ